MILSVGRGGANQLGVKMLALIGWDLLDEAGFVDARSEFKVLPEAWPLRTAGWLVIE